ncbi:hypothetical protein [Azohydromonas australica]|uniref:hypothetical protein n=1 Tax=Azohydromonas australica TaxID=364039 RepID=UPI000404F22A|nr:hypothetical protein [Azohydromonas australica]
MVRKPKPTFIHEFPLRVDRAQAHALEKRFGVVHFAYNVVLQEMLARLRSMRNDPRYAQACKAPKGDDAQRKAHGFSEFAAHDVVALHIRASRYLDGLIDSHTAQTLASRAFRACDEHAFGKRGQPRFKRRGEIASVEGKGPTSPLNWKGDRVVWGGKRRDRAMTLRPVFDKRDRDGVQAHALSGKVKYVRLIRRTIQGEVRWFVQLVCDGLPLQRFEARDGVAAIDLGPSTAAIVASDKAALVSFLPEVKEDMAARRRLQRAMDRSRRATNPQCFNEDGTWRKGTRATERSIRYLALCRHLAEQERVMAERRDRAHSRLANIVLRDFGKVVRTEKLSKKAWQKNWGRRMKATAPGMFMEKVSRKAGNAGGSLVEFNAGRHKLSQFDHTRGDFVRKPLSLRWHELRDGSGQIVQRDLYSAWLALFVSADGLDASQASQAWAVAYPLLARAASSPVQAASWRPAAASRPLRGVGAARMRERQERAARPAQKAEESRVTP